MAVSHFLSPKNTLTYKFSSKSLRQDLMFDYVIINFQYLNWKLLKKRNLGMYEVSNFL